MVTTIEHQGFLAPLTASLYLDLLHACASLLLSDACAAILWPDDLHSFC